MNRYDAFSDPPRPPEEMAPDPQNLSERLPPAHQASPPKKPTVSPNLSAVGDVLTTISQQLQVEERMKTWSVLSLWKEVTPAPFCDRSEARRVVEKQGKPQLEVWVQDATTASLLSFQVPKLLKALNQYAPQTGITLTGIQLRVGPVYGIQKDLTEP